MDHLATAPAMESIEKVCGIEKYGRNSVCTAYMEILMKTVSKYRVPKVGPGTSRLL